MKKLLMTMLALAGLSAFAAPSWIYFYIDQLAGGYSDYTFDYATVQAGSDNLKINGEDWPLYANEDGLTTSEVYAGEFDSSYTGDLIFTLWKEGADTFSYFANYSYADWKNYAYTNMGQTGAEAMLVSANSSVPEPISGVLLLFGLAGLALRRKTSK